PRGWPRWVGFLPVFCPPERGLRQGPVHRLPAPLDALEPVVLGQAELPESEEDSGIGPLLEPAMGRGVRADAGGVERAPLAAGAEQEEDRVHGAAGIDAGVMAAPRGGAPGRQQLHASAPA